ncbi:MAG: lipocalin family protein [Nonlabens sp.]|uniref:lipocalin family protein n=1 Tax=Nonlabens sp. TaxID=1888209 RepID=UPI003EF68506
MRKLILLIAFITITSCSNNATEMVNSMEGYWNIETVTLPDGTEREFPFSNHMDHFEIEGSMGVKNRVSPTYDGQFVNYGSPVPFTWETVDGKVVLTFKDGEGRHQQTLKKCNESTLVLLHENGTEYIYKAHENAQE